MRRKAADATAVAANPEESLEELAALAQSAGASVAGRLIQVRDAPDAATLIGFGKVEELAAMVITVDATLVIFDVELTPTQLRNLERKLDVRVVDRTQLILDLFASRARTSEGQLQVELAQLNYLLPRLSGRGSSMSRLGGGIGTRGPGETQLETDRRKIARRIKRIEENLEGVRSGRAIQRRQRQSVPLATVALVGYTNAGKSTMFNRLTGAAVAADARMFATLDPTVRHHTLPSKRRILFSDTVGFIRNLPVTLVRAFRATLEEVVEARLLLHVVDASSQHAPAQTSHVMKVLVEIGAGETPQILVMNKADRLSGEAQVSGLPGSDSIALSQRILAECSTEMAPPRAVAVSGLTGEGIDRLTALIDEAMAIDPISTARFRVPAGDGQTLHLLHEGARITGKRYEGESCEIEAEVPESLRRRLAAFLI